ncbi:MAG: hypothetical protein K0V04_23820 [Deltaproteobacteria bacterium]|nr:hypothetical protein [Deltaproteobacteria bacterium]
MHIAGLILGILGGLAAGALGMTWLSDVSSVDPEVAALADLSGITTAGYLLILALVLGITGGVLALRRKGRWAAALMIPAAVAPAIVEPSALVFTFLLLIGGLLSLGAKPRAPAYASS